MPKIPEAVSKERFADRLDRASNWKARQALLDGASSGLLLLVQAVYLKSCPLWPAGEAIARQISNTLRKRRGLPPILVAREELAEARAGHEFRKIMIRKLNGKTVAGLTPKKV